MIGKNWIDNRTGLRSTFRRMLDEPIPGRARWRHVWGAVVLFLFLIELTTGVLLMTVYSPSATNAWSSVWYLQTQVPFGWLFRGLHNFASHTLLIALGLYLLQILFRRAYRAPRELIWWLGLAMIALTLALCVTGSLLPWDQQAYGSTKVRINIVAMTPLIGDALRRILLGGTDIGQLSITRFYTLHVMLLPAGFAILLALHRLAILRTGRPLAPKSDEKNHTAYWPNQFFKDSVACALLLSTLLTAVWFAHARLHGTLLGAPANPTDAYYPARPEWWALFLFQWLKHFESPTMEVWGAIVVPGVLVVVGLLLPFAHRLLPPRIAHGLILASTLLLLSMVGFLSYEALAADRRPPAKALAAIHATQRSKKTLSEKQQTMLRADAFHRQRKRAKRETRRIFQLASQQGIPPDGPLTLLNNDPLTRGPVLFARHCATCHRFAGHNGLGNIPAEPAASSDLAGYGTREWVRGLLENPMDDHYFGRMVTPNGDPAHTRMNKWTRSIREDNEQEEKRWILLANFDAVAAYLADEAIHPGRFAGVKAAHLPPTSDTENDTGSVEGESLLLRGRHFFLEQCNECHSYKGERSGTFKAPEMYGYASVAWIERMIANPADKARYRSKGREHARMPAFADRLLEKDRKLIARWLHDPNETRNKQAPQVVSK